MRLLRDTKDPRALLIVESVPLREEWHFNFPFSDNIVIPLVQDQ